MALKKTAVIALVMAGIVPMIQADISTKQVSKDNIMKSDLKIRYIDLSAAMRTSKEGAIVSKKLDTERTKLAQEVQQKEQAYVKAVEDYKSKESMLSADARSKEQLRVAELEQSYKNSAQMNETKFKSVAQAETEKLAKEVEKAVQKLAEAENLDSVIDVYTGRVLFASEKSNVTLAIIEDMDKVFLAKSDADKKATA